MPLWYSLGITLHMVQILLGVNENARTENAAPSKMKGWQTRDRNAMERRKCINEQNCEANNKHALA